MDGVEAGINPLVVTTARTREIETETEGTLEGMTEETIEETIEEKIEETIEGTIEGTTEETIEEMTEEMTEGMIIGRMVTMEDMGVGVEISMAKEIITGMGTPTHRSVIHFEKYCYLIYLFFVSIDRLI